MDSTRKIAINTCYGGFGLSPKALLWLFEHGCKDIAVSVADWYSTPESYSKDVTSYEWYLKDDGYDMFIVTFSDCRQFVLKDIFATNHKLRESDKLIECIEHLGEEASIKAYSRIEIVEIPSSVDWSIECDDGREIIVEKHRIWKGSNHE